MAGLMGKSCSRSSKNFRYRATNVGLMHDRHRTDKEAFAMRGLAWRLQGTLQGNLQGNKGNSSQA